jgi:hypothetical protein
MVKFNFLRKIKELDNKCQMVAPELDLLIIFGVIVFINFFINKFTLGIVIGALVKDRVVNNLENLNAKYDLWENKTVENIKSDIKRELSKNL